MYKAAANLKWSVLNLTSNKPGFHSVGEGGWFPLKGKRKKKKEKEEKEKVVGEQECVIFCAAVCMQVINNPL